MKYREMTAEQRKAEFEKVSAEFEAWKAKGLKLNMARGRPGKEQLDLVSDILSVMTDPADCVDGDVNVRNYGQLSGLPSAKALFAEILGCKPEQVFVGGNASLQLMYDTIAKAYTNGLLHSEKPWCREEHIKWLCPAPGYDRHFKVTESFGFELITIPMTETGPNMDLVEQLVKDPAVKGMWNVPKYSNPDGIIYSDETIERIARLKPAAPDFLLMWDNASTSKITLPGAGVACFACSEANMEYMEKLINVQIISYDKINQLRHVKYLKDKAHTLELMKKHAAIMGPKFKAVTETLAREVGPLGLATWHDPKGGYFVSVNTLPGLAKRTLALCKEAGVIMTSAGATFPYGVDPKDSNIRVAPSLPPVEELQQAMEVFCCCLKLAALEQLK